MPTKRVSAPDLRQSIAAAKTKPINPARGRTIWQNVKQSLNRVLSVPRTEGTGTLQT
jgi:hypothetical protein